MKKNKPDNSGPSSPPVPPQQGLTPIGEWVRVRSVGGGDYRMEVLSVYPGNELDITASRTDLKQIALHYAFKKINEMAGAQK